MAEPARAARLGMIALAFFATVINYLDRFQRATPEAAQVLSVAAPVLRDAFQMSNVEYSQVVSAFMLAYTVMNGLSGPLIDRIGTRAWYAICMAWRSAAAMLHVFARGPFSLGVYRFLLGMGEAGNWPAAVKVVAEWFPQRERALASGIFNSGSSAGAILVPPLVAWVLLQFGWHTAFLAVGASGLVWLAIWLPVYRTPADVLREQAADRVPVRELLRNRFVWSFTSAKIFLDPVWYFYIFWFPEYLKRVRGFDIAAIGKYAWFPFLVAAFGNLAGGWMSAALLRRGLSLDAARKTSIAFFIVLMLSAIPAVLLPSPWLSIAFVSLAMLGYTGCSANMLALPADVFPGSAVASVYGFASMGSGFGGMLFALGTGWVVDHWSYTPVFFGFGLMPLVCLAILVLFAGRIRARRAIIGV